MVRSSSASAVFSPPAVVAAGLAAVLVLHPQPLPQTPTFLQNALLAGLVSGLVHGTRASGGAVAVPLVGGFGTWQ